MAARKNSLVGASAILGLFAMGSQAFAQAPIQLNPFLQSYGYFGGGYPAGVGYYGTYGGVYNYYQPAYPQQCYYYYAPTYSGYPYRSPFYPSYNRYHPPRPSSYRPMTTFVPTDLTRHPPKMANPWFTSPDTRARHGYSGR